MAVNRCCRPLRELPLRAGESHLIEARITLAKKLGFTNLFDSFTINLRDYPLAIQLERSQPKPTDEQGAPKPGWRRARTTPSLVEVYRTIPVAGKGWWRKILAFAGPGYLVAVGYMDPGNWATDLAGGAQFGYTLLSVILASNLMAILLQGLASTLGIVTGRDLAQACRDHYSKPIGFFLWIG